jgi:hypothetical protein
MLRLTLTAVLGVAIFALAGLTSVAEDKKAETKTLEGTLKCTKCALGETKACGNALVVKDGTKSVTYYLVDKGGKAPYHKDCCTADAPAKVTGKVAEKDGKHTIEDPKVEIKK